MRSSPDILSRDSHDTVMHAPFAKPAARSITFSVATSIAELHALQSEWRALFARAGAGSQIFQQFDWLAHWSDHYLNDAPVLQPHILVGRCEGRIVTIWPLVLRRRMGIATLTWMGLPASQYGDVLIEQHRDRDNWLLESWAHLIGTPDLDAIVLRKIRSDSVVSGLLEAKRFRLHNATQAPFIDLETYQCPEEFAARLSSKERRERRRQRRLLGAAGTVDFRMLDAGPEAQSAVADALVFKKAWLSRRGIASAAFADERLQRFFMGISSDASGSAGCCVSVLRAGNAIAAVEIGFRCKGRHVAHVGAFNPEFERCGAGTLQCEDTIAHCIEDGIRTYDLLAPADDYKMSLTDRAVTVGSYAHGMTMPGRLYAEMMKKGLRRFAKQGFQNLPESIRRAITPFFGSGVAASNDLPMLMALI